jgi:hypothetical protein
MPIRDGWKRDIASQDLNIRRALVPLATIPVISSRGRGSMPHWHGHRCRSRSRSRSRPVGGSVARPVAWPRQSSRVVLMVVAVPASTVVPHPILAARPLARVARTPLTIRADTLVTVWVAAVVLGAPEVRACRLAKMEATGDTGAETDPWTARVTTFVDRAEWTKVVQPRLLAAGQAAEVEVAIDCLARDGLHARHSTLAPLAGIVVEGAVPVVSTPEHVGWTASSSCSMLTHVIPASSVHLAIPSCSGALVDRLTTIRSATCVVVAPVRVSEALLLAMFEPAGMVGTEGCFLGFDPLVTVRTPAGVSGTVLPRTTPLFLAVPKMAVMAAAVWLDIPVIRRVAPTRTVRHPALSM